MKPIPELDVAAIPTPAYIVDRSRLEQNAKLLHSVAERTGARVLLALKGFAMFAAFPYVNKWLHGTTSSGLHEALLATETFGGEVHVYSPAFTEPEVRHISRFADHIVFNSLGQWQRLRPIVAAAGREIECGLRVNPGYSEVSVELYNPCAPCSRLGILAEHLEGANLSGISGLHFHSLCEQNADTLERTLEHFERLFGHLIPAMKWINFGGGHHITRDDYDVERLCSIINRFRARYPVDVYLEPGEALALGTGVLVTRVRDIVRNQMEIAILDTSVTAHMPDVLEMPYRPEVVNAGHPGEKRHTYRLAGPTCLAGDIVGDYSFDQPLTIDQELIFLDMAHYTMVKNTTFNGVQLPGIHLYHPDQGRIETIRTFHYDDYKNRLS